MSDDPLLRGLEPPALPAHLREAALAASRAALAQPPRPDVWARLLASRAARLAWAASVAALVAANVLFPRNAPPAAPAATAGSGRPDAELTAIARLPRLDEKTLPVPRRRPLVNRSRNLVLGALAVVVLLAAAFGFRWAAAGTPPAAPPANPPLARWTTPAPPARIPLPVHVDVPKVPCWSCPESEKWPIRFQTNLDVLAPLGDGPANAALWLKDFAKPQGARLAEAEAAMKGRVAGPDDFGLVLPPRHPLLEEAEPWADQATMRFYPDVWGGRGGSTPIPNLLLGLSLAKSWAARAAANPDAPSAIEDCRRAIRWGRLLRQEDATLIQDLVGLAALRIGAEQIYALAARRGDHALMLAAAIVQGEAAPQRLRMAEVKTRLEVSVDGQDALADRKVDDLIVTARGAPDRRFRNEAIVMLGYARFRGTPLQREKAEQALGELKGSSDTFVADNAKWALGLQRGDVAGLSGF